MKVLVLGASGGVGGHLVRQAAEAGHVVTAVSRRPLDVPDGVRLVLDDVLRDGAIDAAMAGQEVVLSALGLRRAGLNPWARLLSPPDFASRTARAIVTAMQRHGVRRVVAVSAAGVAESAGTMNAVMRLLVATSNLGVAYRDLAVMERIYAESGLEALCVRPTALTHGPRTDRVTVVDAFPMTANIARADVAAWMLRHVTGPLPASPTPMISARTSG